MNEEYQVSYYSIIPATVRYDTNLKAAEKLIYGEITSLANRLGYCFAQNRYFANLYKVSIHTVSQWISHLEKQGYIHAQLIKNSRNEVKERRIYIVDNPYVQKNTYPYVSKNTDGMYENVQDNNINNNIDDFFNLVMNNKYIIPTKFYLILERLKLIYSKEILSIMTQDKVQMVKEVIFVLYELYNSKFTYILSQVNADSLFNLYLIAQEHKPIDFLNYYKRSIINKYTYNST